MLGGAVHLVWAAAPVPPAAAAELGRLFTTRAERQSIDRIRRGESAMARSPDPQAPVVAPPQKVTGVVQRSDGQHTIWVDGAARPARADQARREHMGKVAPR
jgi:hypothetical protein